VAPKIIHTRSHLDPELVKVTDDPKKLIRKISLAESQGSSSPPPRETSLPEKFVTIQDIQFDLPFENTLFRTKYESFFG
jgi:hypothetical protein